MNLLLLRQFITVADLGSITKAAEELFISQPALSKAIKTLETYYECSLFERKGRSIELNSNGKILYKYACEILSALENAESEIKENKQNEENSISISIFSSSKIFPSLMAKFSEENPKATFKINQNYHFGDNSTFTIFSSSEKIVEDGNIIPLLTEKIMLCVPDSHPLADREIVSVKDIKDQDFIELSEGTDLRRITNSLKSKYKIEYNIACESDNPQLVREMIVLGIGLSFVPEKTWKIDMRNLRMVDIKEKGFVRHIYLKIQENKYISKLESKFVKFLIEEYRCL